MSPLQTRLKDRMELRAREEWPEMDQFVQLRKRIQDLYRPGMSVLDIGCGCGHTLPSLRKIDPDIDYRGIDLSDSMLSEARSLFPEVPFERGNVEDLGEREPSDIVICYMLLLHLDGYERALESLARVSGRHLLLRTLLSPEEYRIKRFRKDGAWFWYNMYDEERFTGKLRDLGFSRIEVVESPLQNPIPYQDEWSTWSLGDRQVFGQMILPWKMIHAQRDA